MPYQTIDDLPPEVRDNLSPALQQRWLEVFNKVLKQTGDEQKAILAAWGAVRKARETAGLGAASLALKSDGDRYTVEGWGMLFTSPDDRDLSGEFFTTMTRTLAEFYQDAPLWYEHGLDIDYGVDPIGKRVQLEVYGFGLYVKHALFPDHPLIERTLDEIRSGKLSYSSDSLSHYVEQGYNWANGELRTWPLAGWSLTANPAEPALGPVTLSGLEATIEELQATPTRRIAIKGGAVLVLPEGVTPASQPDNHEAQPDGSRAREALKAEGDASPSYAHTFTKESPMDPEVLAQLAEFLGVEATPEAVAAALEALLSQLTSEEDMAAESEVPAPDMAALRSALSVPEDAGDDVVVARLKTLLEAIDTDGSEVEEEEPAPARAFDFKALARAYKALENDNGRQMQDAVPYKTRPTNPDAKRSRSLHAPNVNRGARKPGLYDAVMAGLGVKTDAYKHTTFEAMRRDVSSTKAMSVTDNLHGGFVLNREISSEIIEPFTAQEVVMAAGAQRIPMDGIETLTINAQTTLPTASWHGEAQNVDESEVELGQITLTLKTLTVAVRYPNRLLRNASVNINTMLQNSMVKAARLGADLAFLRGSGGKPADGRSSGKEPLGLRNIAGVTIQADQGGVADIPMLKGMEKVLLNNDVEENETWGWIGHPSLFADYEYMIDANGRPVLRDSWGDQPYELLMNRAVHKTTQIPLTLGAGGNETELYFGDWSQAAVGYGLDVQMIVSQEAYVRSLETLIILVLETDFGAFHPDAFVVQPGIQVT